MGTERRHELFVSVYDTHVWDVYGYLAYRTGSPEAAEDLTQATFERALRAWSRFDPGRASARTWLLSIAHNLLVDHYRRQGSVRHEPLGDAAEYEVVGIDDPALHRSLGLSPELEAALAELGDRGRELIALRFGGDLSGPEISEITGLSLANVQQILSRSLRQLRARLDEAMAVKTRLG